MLELDYEKKTDSVYFIKLLDCLVNFTDLGLIDRLVYCAVLTYARALGHIFTAASTAEAPCCLAGDKTIAKRLGITETEVKASLQYLEWLEIIEIKYEKNGKRCIYVLRDFEDVQPEEE